MDDDTASYKYKSDDYSGEQDEHKSLPFAVENTFHDHLERQIGLLNLKDEKQYKIALQIIGSIDDDGYLRRECVSIIDDLIFLKILIRTKKKYYPFYTKFNLSTHQVLGREIYKNVYCCK